MVKRNAARHLLFAVSLLLFFFVYMGYRLRGSAAVAPAPAEVSAPSEAVAPLVPATASSAVAPTASPLRPVSTQAPAAMEDDRVEDLSGWVPSGRGENLRLTPPPTSGSTASSAPLRPTPSATTAHTGSITGLVPERSASAAVTSEPGEPDSAATGGLALPLPGSGGLRPVTSAPEAAPAERTPQSLPALPMPTPETSSVVPTRPASQVNASPLPGLESAGMEDDMPSTPVRSPVRVQATPPERSTSPAASLPPPTPPTRPTPSAEMGDAAPTGPARLPTAPSGAGGPTGGGSDTTRVYVIRPGDTLSNIAARELGSASLADNIFLFNRGVIIDPDQLMVGQKIRLPAGDGSGGAIVSQTPDSPAPLRRPTQGLGRVHRVARGDTLSSIAQQYYGTSSGWRFLYEANRTVVPDPNRLSVGTELTVPPYEH